MVGQTKSDPESAKQLKIDVPVAGRVFSFDLLCKPLSLGDAGEIQWYWMDTRKFRQALKESESTFLNLRNCIGLWWRAAKVAGASREPSQIQHLLLASCYGLFGNDKALQDVYHDAYLSRANSRSDTPENGLDENSLAIATDYSSADVAKLLGGQLTDSSRTAEEIEFIELAIGSILREGLLGFQKNPQQGTLDFVNKIDAWSTSVRKRGGHPWRRMCLNQFEYSSKVSFYRCYATAWIHIVAALEQQGLDALSSLFLRFWHWQNQPTPQPDGRMEPDAFGGQILALHPLWGFFRKDPNLLAIAGKFFKNVTTEEFDAGTFGIRNEYRTLVGAIVLAAQRYEDSRQQQAAQRLQPEKRSKFQSNLASPGITQADSISGMFRLTEFLAAVNTCCSACQGPLECREVAPVPLGTNAAILQADCRNCHRQRQVEISRQQLTAFLFEIAD